MPQAYSLANLADVALSAATAKTILTVRAASTARVVQLQELAVWFDGVTGNAENVAVELCHYTMAGTGTSTAQTPEQTSGQVGACASVGAVNYTAEPTVAAVLKTWGIPPAGGWIVLPLDAERLPESRTGGAQASALGIRCNAPAAVNVRGYMEFKE